MPPLEPTAEKKTGLRRSHVKSRNGCGQCKARRKKCDERPPTCSNCKRRNLKCDYEDLFNTESPSSSPWETAEGNAEELNIVFEFSQSVTSSAGSEHVPKPTSNVVQVRGNAEEEEEEEVDPNAWLTPFPQWIRHPSNPVYLDHPGQSNELMFHFLTNASHTLAPDNAGVFQYWQQIAYSIAQEHDFVRHTLLAYSSLHIAHLQPQESQKYVVLTSHHHAIAINGFKEQVTAINGGNCDAIFIFSALLVLTELGLMRPVWDDGSNADIDPVDKLIQQLNVVRNILTLWRDAQLVRTEPMIRELIGHGRHPYAEAIVAEAKANLAYLERINQKMVTDPDDQIMFSKSVRELGVCYYFAILRPLNWFPILRWAKAISPAFILRLKTRHPLALLILAQYCVLVHRISRNHWWMRGWSEQIFHHVVSLLDGQWMPFLRSATAAMNET
ncbi:hypothetical protein TMatcc_001366 [Talaromyces marneffei ATCC 18224]|uniref:Zn(2)-C6 fungal-type domain-containing protein n=1 Tax=Talaromyces marneffei (strain ATCC 18224 / CBS 334.59 / QM 7333) TaxID=441960 RepID=B6QJS2_TALMQ|nr:conserved hypothetical protein [Talaromyces marneffei ATCC 18224]